VRKETEIIGIEQVAELLGVSVRTVQRHIDDAGGEFPGRKIGSKWVFDKQQIIEWVRGEWKLQAPTKTQMDLIEQERKNWGVDLPETLVNQQQYLRERDNEKE
jgi:excisionase family DNA binding protein